MIERRACERFVVPGATVSVMVRGFLGRLKPLPEDPFPMADLSKGGLSFLTDSPPKKEKDLSILLTLSEKEPPLSLEGRVVHVRLNTGVSYRYRVGVQFKPFEQKRGSNDPEALRKLDELERMYGSQGREKK